MRLARLKEFFRLAPEGGVAHGISFINEIEVKTNGHAQAKGQLGTHAR